MPQPRASTLDPGPPPVGAAGQPLADGDPRLLITIHFAGAGPRERRSRRRRRPLERLVLVYGGFGLGTALFIFTRLLVRALRLPMVALGVFWVTLAAAGAAYFGWLLVRRLWAQRRVVGKPTQTDPRYRIRCIGPPDRLARLAALGPITDTPFEPQEFPGFLTMRPRGAMIPVWIAVSVLTGAGALLLPLGVPPGAHVFVFYGAFAAGGIMVSLLWPTSIRVVPGRIDLSRRLVFRPDNPERRTLTLRSPGIVVDLRRWSLNIHGPTKETSLEVWLWPIRGRMELAHAVLMGAVSSTRVGVGDGSPLLPGGGG